MVDWEELEYEERLKEHYGRMQAGNAQVGREVRETLFAQETEAPEEVAETRRCKGSERTRTKLKPRWGRSGGMFRGFTDL